jgi:probable rRNA maturation factor
MTVTVEDEHTSAGGTRAQAGVETDRLQRLAEFVLADREVPAEAETSVTCLDWEAMAELNAAHMGEDGATDVLAFPLEEPEELARWSARGSARGSGGRAPARGAGQALDTAAAVRSPPMLVGDVVVCPAVAAEQAREHARETADELDLLVVHGLLHLLGYDHAEPDEAEAMFALTEQLLTRWAETPPGL